MGAKQRGTDAGRVMVLTLQKSVRLVKFSPDFLSYGFSLCRRLQEIFTQVFQYQYKFVTAEARHSVAFTHAGFQTLRNLLQQQIADVMAERIVKRFEIIQINE